MTEIDEMTAIEATSLRVNFEYSWAEAVSLGGSSEQAAMFYLPKDPSRRPTISLVYWRNSATLQHLSSYESTHLVSHPLGCY